MLLNYGGMVGVIIKNKNKIFKTYYKSFDIRTMFDFRIGKLF